MDNIPDDCMVLVCSYLSVSDCVAVTMTCHQWHRLIAISKRLRKRLSRARSRCIRAPCAIYKYIVPPASSRYLVDGPSGSAFTNVTCRISLSPDEMKYLVEATVNQTCCALSGARGRQSGLRFDERFRVTLASSISVASFVASSDSGLMVVPFENAKWEVCRLENSNGVTQPPPVGSGVMAGTLTIGVVVGGGETANGKCLRDWVGPKVAASRDLRPKFLMFFDQIVGFRGDRELKYCPRNLLSSTLALGRAECVIDAKAMDKIGTLVFRSAEGEIQERLEDSVMVPTSHHIRVGGDETSPPSSSPEKLLQFGWVWIGDPVKRFCLVNPQDLSISGTSDILNLRKRAGWLGPTCGRHVAVTKDENGQDAAVFGIWTSEEADYTSLAGSPRSVEFSLGVLSLEGRGRMLRQVAGVRNTLGPRMDSRPEVNAVFDGPPGKGIVLAAFDAEEDDLRSHPAAIQVSRVVPVVGGSNLGTRSVLVPPTRGRGGQSSEVGGFSSVISLSYSGVVLGTNMQGCGVAEWDLESGDFVGRIRGLDADTLARAPAFGSSSFVAIGGRSLRLWDHRTAKGGVKIKGTFESSHLICEDHLVATVCDERVITLWDLRKNGPTSLSPVGKAYAWPYGAITSLSRVSSSPNHKRFLVTVEGYDDSCWLETCDVLSWKIHALRMLSEEKMTLITRHVEEQ